MCLAHMEDIGQIALPLTEAVEHREATSGISRFRCIHLFGVSLNLVQSEVDL